MATLVTIFKAKHVPLGFENSVPVGYIYMP